MEKADKHEVLIVIPTYNEAENIEALVRAIKGIRLPLDVLVVDDASPDGTGEIVERLMRQFEGLFVLHRPKKMGLGTAYIAGFQYALAHRYKMIMTMDSDFSHHPRYIPDLLAQSTAYDIVIGSRYVPGGGVQNWSIIRRAVSFVANKLARAILGLSSYDNTAGFRLYNRRVLEAIHFDRIQSNGYAFLVEMLYLCKKSHFNIGEVPIIFEDRRVGKSKISKTEILMAMKTLAIYGFDRLGSRTGQAGKRS
ncbi:MAG: polyprenol monophosphomannose synthase [Deltaproteobacteria bacterium]|nr:polyprenol monophosphomannose synthase [Deltaproteobacteria bacterium]MBW2018482.1 polyprenol monophosphomannose synthase [Deltaproteobacteria bacterium]MBW2074139.1 polyprenol monophosphomannose synthase [Deltaproteobacteria bacterium]RLB83638.1 MAG: polyprenol monophosphomannose synthase [Deltaproteobacteria bacterium]